MTHPSMMRLMLAWGITLLWLSQAWAAGDIPTVLRQVSTQLVFDKTIYDLGENIFAHYGITNMGTQDITITTGGDYRGAPRALRFHVTAVGEKGETVDDPYRDIMCLGGIEAPFTLKPGETYWASLPLLHYCDFPTAGAYTVQVYHDLGWGPRTPASPVAIGKLVLRMPSAQQAAQIVAKMAALPENSGGTNGQRRAPYADFSVLRYPVYLPKLVAYTQRGDARALDGIASIRTPEATRALMNCTAHANRAIADRALLALILRLPVAEKTTRYYWGTRLRGLSEWSWSGHLAPDVVKIAWRLLAATDRQRLIYGANIIQQIGKSTDLPRLCVTLDRVLTLMKNDPAEQRDYPRPAIACAALVTAGEGLLARGGIVTSTQTNAQGIMQLCAMKQNPAYHPAGWQATARRLLMSPIPFVRATALEKMPLPLDLAFIDLVSTLIHDPFTATQAAALDLAERTKVARFGEDALQVLTVTKDEWIVGIAFQTAKQCGIPQDKVLEVCINRFDEPGMIMMLFQPIMSSVFIHEGGYGTSGTITPDEARRLKTRWQTFLAENREALHAGKAFAIAVPPVTEDLLPAGYHFHRRDGSLWPAQPNER